VTRFAITLVCLEAEYRSGRFRSDYYSQGKWLRPGELSRYPVSSPQRRLAVAVADPHRQGRLF
jgi:A/G-specific adenine glycosylase